MEKTEVFEDLKILDVQDLRLLLRQKSLSIEGEKADLVARIRNILV